MGDDVGVKEGLMLGCEVILVGNSLGLLEVPKGVGAAVVGAEVITLGPSLGLSVGGGSVGLAVGGGGGTPSNRSLGSKK